MAIHAICTNRRFFDFYKLLFLKDILKKQYWHNRCTYHSTLALQELTELIDMSLIQEKFSSPVSYTHLTLPTKRIV